MCAGTRGWVRETIMIRLETERLIIRNFRASDWEALHEMIVQYEASELAAYDQPWPTMPEEIQKVAEWFASGDSFLAVCLNDEPHRDSGAHRHDTGRFIGFVALNEEGQTDGGRVFNLGYVFNFSYHGQGYATEACRAVLDHAFEQLGAAKVVTGTAAVNTASCRLLERLGFKKTGESTGCFRNAPDGKLIEFLGYSYALSREEWQGAGKRE
jgi:ribosomal-protein-alanine N-acetyltransferase